MTATDLPAAAGATTSARPRIWRWFREQSTLRQVAVVGTGLLALAFAFTALRVAGRTVLWENLHSTVAAVLAVLLAWLGARQAGDMDRTVRRILAVSLGIYLIGRIIWDIQVALGVVTIPAPSDIFFLGSAIPAALAFAISIRGRLGAGNERAAYLDTLAIAGAIATVIAAAHAPAILAAQSLEAAVMLLYPIGFVLVSVAALVTALAVRIQPTFGGSYGISLGFAVLALAWVEWLSQSTLVPPAPGSLVNYALSVGTVVVGWSAATWAARSTDTPTVAAVARALAAALPLLAVTAIVVMLIFSEDLLGPASNRFFDYGTAVLIVLVVLRQAVLLRERAATLAREADLLEQERRSREELQRALVAQHESQARYREVVDVFARLAEQIAFASEERDLVRAAMAALSQIVPTRHGDILLANPSQDRLIVGAAWGWHPAEAGSAASVDGPLRCPGIRRGTVHSLENAADLLQLACPAHPARSGSVLCVPMLAQGQVVGVIHLGRSGIRAFSGDDQRQATRVGEQVALALSNLRLARSMEGMAMTDALTGLHNARFFDPFLERELASAARDGQPMGLLMIDIDHFKDFNDQYGHPAGDDALRAFARTVLGSLRESDTVARYGGEEFVVALRGTDLEAAATVAEKLRIAVEQTVVELGPGRYGRLTVSIGVASTSAHGTDRRTLVKVADQALYQAKQAGRNQVAVAPRPYRSHERRSSAAAGARLRGRSKGAGAGRSPVKRGDPPGSGRSKSAPTETARARRKPPGTGRRDAA